MTYQPREFTADAKRKPAAHPQLFAPKKGSRRKAPLISIVVPVKDEENAVRPYVERVSEVLEGIVRKDDWEILFVDDGSTDETIVAIAAAHLRDPRVRAISLSRNFGKEAAISAGLEHARGQAVVPMDVDMQDPPEVLVEMIAKWREGYEMVFGVRRNRAQQLRLEAHDGWALLSRSQLDLEQQDSRECRGLPPARQESGRRDPHTSRTQPLYEETLRLGRFSADGG